ncbi:molybdopterin-dependent oxidoreductase [Pseudonocardia sp. GCM10023141]|uniref:molybdopterin-dependent oxidoreductase n=1 Tax=Pseudonocardia sp. GCM10023141 TaxID=3252653 RepID=UPI003614F306
MSTTVAPPRPTAPRRSGIHWAVAAGLGLLSVGAALGVAHLVAGIVSPGSSPFISVADAVVRLSPSWLTEFGKSLGPVWDKLLLKIGVAVVLVVVAAVAGILGRHRPEPATRIIMGLGVIGFLAVVLAPTFSPLDLIAPAVALGAGVLAFRQLHRRALAVHVEGPGAPAAGGVSRRTVLLSSSAAVGVLGLGAGAAGELLGRGLVDSRAAVTARLAQLPLAERAPALPAGAAFPESGTPTFLTANADFYRIDVALRIPSQAAESWKLRIHGMVGKEISLTFDDLLARRLVERPITMTCVSNPVGGDLISTANFIGVELRDILLEAGVRPGADQILTTSVDGWTAGTPTDVVMEPGRGALLVVGMNGEALPPEHGFPVRMVVPGLYGYVSGTKWITDMELTTFAARSGYWIDRGWSARGPVKTEARIDLPSDRATVPAGRVTVAGIAWSQPTGISKVEVRMDGGPWQVADLSTEVSTSTWRMWRREFTLAPGSHTVQTRATDHKGVTQTEEAADVVPDGATGWPATLFTVA